MVSTVKFSAFAAANLNDNTNQLVGIGGGVNIRADKVTTWTTAGRPTPPFNGLSGYNTTLSQWEYYNSVTSMWIQFANNAISNATYILQTVNSLLPNAQALGALATGILKSTTTSGVVSISAPLTSIDGLSTSADEMIYTTGSNVYATTALTSFARTLIADTTAAQMRSTLGLGTAALKAATDNSQPDLVSAKGAFTIGHLLIAADTLGTAKDGGVPFGGGTVTEIDTGTGLTGGPITTTGTVSFANISNNMILANISGISAPPIANTLSNILDDILGSAQGNIIFRNATGWTVLAPSTSGFVLSTGGAAADISWVSNGNGTVTSIATNNGITGGTITTSGTIGLASIADHTLLANTSGGAAAPISTTLTTLIDNAIGSTQGDILYRNSTTWVVLAPGTSGQFLTTGGAAANPSWTSQVAPTGAALTKTDDTNVTLTLGGSPTVALLAATSLTLGWTGQLGLTRGGTNNNLTASAGGIVWSDASKLNILAGTSTASQILLSGNAATPSWSTTTYPATNAINTIMFASSANVLGVITPANSSVLTSSAGGVPSWNTSLPAGTGINTTMVMKQGSGGGNYTTTSASFVDVDGTNLAYTVTIPTGYKMLINCSFCMNNTTLNQTNQYCLADSTTTLVAGEFDEGTGSQFKSVSLTYIFNGDGSSHTFKLRYLAEANTATILNSSSTFTPTMTFLMCPSS